MLSQGKYAIELLHKAEMFSCKPVNTSLSTSEKLSVYPGDILGPQDVTNFHSIIGGLQYLTLTQTDLSFVVNMVC
jgi:hypothetical protein